MFSIEIISTFKAIDPHLKQSYDKQNLTLVVISYEIYETRRRLVSLITYEMTTPIRSSIVSCISITQLFVVLKLVTIPVAL